MKNKKMLRITSFLLCLIIAFSTTFLTEAKEVEIGKQIYGKEEQYQYVDDVDEYVRQLNSGLAKPINTTIVTYESTDNTPATVMPFGMVGDPSKNCSNIFGHKWTDWSGWYEHSRIHKSEGPCISVIKRERYCTRTHCGAYQQETDTVFINSCTH